MSDSAPSIEEMRHMVTRPDSRDYYPSVSDTRWCEKCGTEKSDFWLIVNRHTYCRSCSCGKEKSPAEAPLAAV